MAEEPKEKGKLLSDKAAPGVHPVFGVPEDCFDLLNAYGTYEVQRTADTENEFPRIAHGTPKREKDRVITKDDLKKET